MIQASKVIVDIISKIYSDRTENNKETRLVIPGLTDLIAKEVHLGLLNLNMPSLLVVEPGSKHFEVSKKERIIEPDALVSFRYGSIFIVGTPGVIPSFQDSIKGEGAPFKTFAFSEEWPWSKQSMDEFNLDDFLLYISDVRGDEFNWFKEVIRSILNYLKVLNLSVRAQFLFEKILNNNFKLDYSRHNCIKALLVPGNSDTVYDNFPKYINEVTALAKKVILQIQRADFIRGDLIQSCTEKVTEGEIPAEVLEYLEQFFDSILSTINNFPECFIFARFFEKNPHAWEYFTLPIIKEIFWITEPTKASISIKKIEILYPSKTGLLLRPVHSVSSDNGEVLAFENDVVRLHFSLENQASNTTQLIIKLNREE